MTIEVIGAGFGRTGTASLKLALEQLGFGPAYHMGELIGDIERNVPLWERVAEGAPEWDSIFEGYRSTTDFPACTYWREMMAYYPEAPVILTVRDPESWFDSVYETILSPAFVQHTLDGPFGAMFRGNVYCHFGDGIHDRAHMVDAFERHVDAVREGVPDDRLLVFEAKDGWGPLCDFLDVSVPDEPYPRVNSRAETAALIATVMAAGDGDLESTMEQERNRLFE
jgi:hypothetical protein